MTKQHDIVINTIVSREQVKKEMVTYPTNLIAFEQWSKQSGNPADYKFLTHARTYTRTKGKKCCIVIWIFQNEWAPSWVNGPFSNLWEDYIIFIDWLVIKLFEECYVELNNACNGWTFQNLLEALIRWLFILWPCQYDTSWDTTWNMCTTHIGALKHLNDLFMHRDTWVIYSHIVNKVFFFLKMKSMFLDKK